MICKLLGRKSYRVIAKKMLIYAIKYQINRP